MQLFHPYVARWFSTRFERPSQPQEMGWREIAAGRDTLIAAPTGSGKTLAAFLWSIDALVRDAAAGKLADQTRVVYVSPLKALSNDIQKNLQEPLRQILALAAADGHMLPDIRVAVRTGDTPARERQAMARQPPHILITTPESLYILLTAERSRQALRTARAVIVDEIHAVAGDKRGCHLALSLERLDALAGRPLQRIGLSATQKPIEEIARLLVGEARAADCAIVDAGHSRRMDLSIQVPDQELGPIATHEMWGEVYDRIVLQINGCRTTLVFVNTRRLVERVAHQLAGRLGEDRVAAHHGSMSRQSRWEAEQKLKAGQVSVVVATASLELGIDIGHVDLVCQLGAPRAVATLLQRVGRSGHWLDAVPRGILYPLTRDELVTCAAAVRAIRAGQLDQVVMPRQPLDILAQQVVATVASTTAPAAPADETLPPDEGVDEEELWNMVRRAYPYRGLTRPEWEEILEMLSEGVATSKGRRSAHLHRDRVNHKLWARRGARLVAITNGGAIPDTADYDVVEAVTETVVGKINEDFAIESLAGDIFLLGNKSWRILRVGFGKVWVADAAGAPPTIPFWLGEAPARTDLLSQAVSDLRRDVAIRLADDDVARWVETETLCSPDAASQLVIYIRETVQALGCVPTTECIVAERFFDEAGGMQLVLHAPFGGRINRAWGLALRKRFCVTFDLELQAAATDDGVVISLGERHSFPLESIFSYVRTPTLEADLIQAAVTSPMFMNRWRWNATRALALERVRGGKRVPMAIQRMRAEDLLTAVFPHATMCQDNRSGPVEVPNDHALVRETMQNCLREAMDLDGLAALIDKLECGELQAVARETSSPSPMSHEILNANPYAFLDDAPLEERRARAVSLRRTDAGLADSIGALSVEAIAEVREQARADIRSPNELHDLLLSVGLLPQQETRSWEEYAAVLVAAGRATRVYYDERSAYVAAERLTWLPALLPAYEVRPHLAAPPGARALDAEDVVAAVVHGWMDMLGPTNIAALAQRCSLSEYQVTQGLLRLENRGVVLRGRFTPQSSGEEWCERGLLARIHRLTLGRLRREIEAVTAADFMRFLLRWQHVHPATQLHGRDGLLQIIGQLQGLELPAAAWEELVLPARVARYQAADLENLCLAGAVTWGRLRTQEPDDEVRNRRVTPTRAAALGFLLREDVPWLLEQDPQPQLDLSPGARKVVEFLERHGASFLTDIARGTGTPGAWAEEALWELVVRGLVSGDGVAGLRSLLSSHLHPHRKQRAGARADRLLPVGRWSLWRSSSTVTTAGDSQLSPEQRDEKVALQLLQRYGVVFRELLARETRLTSWRGLLQIFRRMEAQGRIRGGRFVNGFVGEQYALPQAVEALRAVRRNAAADEVVVIAACDPLNLVGILTPQARVSPYSNQAIVLRQGVPIEVGPHGALLRQLRHTTQYAAIST